MKFHSITVQDSISRDFRLIDQQYIYILAAFLQESVVFVYYFDVILEHQNNKQKLQILKALHIRNMQPTHLIELIFKPVLIYLNVFSY